MEWNSYIGMAVIAMALAQIIMLILFIFQGRNKDLAYLERRISAELREELRRNREETNLELKNQSESLTKQMSDISSTMTKQVSELSTGLSKHFETFSQQQSDMMKAVSGNQGETFRYTMESLELMRHTLDENLVALQHENRFELERLKQMINERFPKLM